MPSVLKKDLARGAGASRSATINLAEYSSAGFDRGASRFKEALWMIAKCVFFLHPLPVPSVIRCMVLRSFGAKIGCGVVIRSRTNISFPWRLTIGDHSWIGEQVEILSLAAVKIGSHVCISQRAYLCTGSHDFHSSRFDLITRPITIEDHCWIAANAFICPGVTVATHSMIGAGVTVTRDVPEGSRLLPPQPHAAPAARATENGRHLFC